MYGYNEIISLGPENILEEVTQEEIFGIFIKSPIIADKGMATYVAPYRNDSQPNCYFEEYDGRLFFFFFSSSPPSHNCFSFIQKCAKLNNYGEAYRYISKELGLKGNKRIQRKVINEPTLELKKIKERRTILYLPRAFNIQDKLFWSQYNISSENLIEDKVIPIQLYKSISRKGVPFVIRTSNIMYAYTDFEDGRVKIYRPYGNKDEKWFTNCTQNDIGGINSLPISGDILIITKSYKDYRVIKNQGVNTVWFQNEGMIPSPTILRSLCKRFKKIVIWFDNDEAGIKAAKLVASHINSLFPGIVITIHLDVELLQEDIKDPSDLEAKKGKEKLINFCKSKKLL